ncbi:hypothetical protein ACFSX9_15460 [Flavobacterium ardleyense]|uniref:DinB superfamily protein n=1 Tax=Flavobacterium ardleyense TaxID=2038737 RepID=A0ABW5ZF93_9FLAO
MELHTLFKDSFDTFKVFAKLDTQKASLLHNNTPKSIWQILNHLIIWQEYQIRKLSAVATAEINEIDTWFASKEVSDEVLLINKIATFETQIETIKEMLRKMTLQDNNSEEKLKIIQDITVHLSFHLGEIITIMRQNGHYPMPHEMEHFLNAE